MKVSILAAITVVLLQWNAAACAQVYRCEVNGKISYSDDPCIGAQRVDVTPTRGLDKLSGKSRKGADVRAEELNKHAADVFRPILGETPEQRATRLRRAHNHLTPGETAECYLLDTRMTSLEQQEKSSSGAELQRIQQALLKQRQQHRKLKC